MKKVASLFLCFFLVGMMGVYAQTRTISGKVVSSDDNSPIPGVSVIVKGTTLGTVTNMDGNYSIQVPQAAQSLMFSFVGYRTVELALEGRTSLDVVMPVDILAVDEVVVTAIGVKREAKTLGYSVQTIDGDDIARSPNTNLVNSLAGKAAGVSVTSSSGAAGASSFVTIRGFASITQNNQPLFVIDGVPIDNSELASVTRTAGAGLSNRSIDLNPEDIESVNVLKGGAATALYGIRAANGAIVITTKKGQATTRQRMDVSFASSVTIEQVSNLPKLQNVYAQGSNGNLDLLTTGSWGPKISDLRYDTSRKTPEYPTGVPIVSSDTSLPQAMAYDNLRNFWQTGIGYNNSLSLSGGNDLTTFYFSLSNLSQESIIPNNTFNRTTVTVSGETKLSAKLSSSARLAYTHSGGNRIQQGSNTSGVMLALTRMPVNFDVTAGLGDPANNPASYMYTDGSMKQRNPYNAGGYDNPYWTVNRNPFKDNVDRLIGSWNLNYTANNWLSFSYRLGTDFFRDARKQIFSIGSRNATTGQVFEDHFFRQDINSDLMANINLNLTNDLKTNIVLGNNMYQYYYQNLYSNIGGLVIPDFYNLSNAASQSTSEYHSKKRTAAMYGDIGFDYKSMVYVNITGRNEWSTTLPAGNNSFFYPSFSGSFIFTELEGLKENNILPYGKIRASYAIIGNDAPIFSTSQYYGAAAAGDGWTTSAIQFPAFATPAYNLSTTLANPELKPETSTSFEVGADLRFVDNRIGLDITYFDLNNEDLILSVPIAGSSGFTSANMNAASMTNKGIEAEVKLVPVRNKDLEWNLDFNFTKLTNEVTKLADGVTSVFLGGFVGKQVRAVTGNPYGSIFGTDFQRNADGVMLIEDDPAKTFYGYPIMDTQDKNIGNVLPDWTLGINNSVKYKDVFLTFLVDIKQGGKMWNGTRGANLHFGMTEGSLERGKEKIFEGVKKSSGQPNDIKVTPGMSWFQSWGGGFNGPGSPYVDDAGWVRLREITLGYNLPKSFLTATGIKSADVFVTGKNLLIFTPYDGVDPETSLYGADNAQGLDYYNMPGVKSVMLGVKVNF